MIQSILERCIILAKFIQYGVSLQDDVQSTAHIILIIFGIAALAAMIIGLMGLFKKKEE